MSATAVAAAGQVEAGAKPKGKSKKKLILLAVPVLLLLAGAGLWFTGILPGLLGMKDAPKPAAEVEHKPQPVLPTFAELPEMVSNLNAPGRRPSFVKLKVKIELAKADDLAGFNAVQPRVIDLFQTYLREMRPDELRDSIGTYRLRQELLARANIAVAPAHVVDILFTELLVQ